VPFACTKHVEQPKRPGRKKGQGRFSYRRPPASREGVETRELEQRLDALIAERRQFTDADNARFANAHLYDFLEARYDIGDPAAVQSDRIRAFLVHMREEVHPGDLNPHRTPEACPLWRRRWRSFAGWRSRRARISGMPDLI
jgi:hypothetical protein